MTKRNYPSAARNRDVILGVLQTLVGPGDRILEVASGTGQHTAHFAQALPGCHFQPTEFEAALHESIAAWTAELSNVAAPISLDAGAPWPELRAQVVVCTNMIHISPWAATLGLFRGAAATLSEGGALLTYGPYRFDGVLAPESNVAFDASLRARNPAWGIRDVADLAKAAAGCGLRLEATIACPANNHCLVWRQDAT